jgi:biopolymer transport protein ExbB/TolQ
MQNDLLPSRWLLRAVFIAIVLVLIALASFWLVPGSVMAALLLDRQPHSIFPYPFTIQNFIYLALAWAFADLLYRWLSARREHALLRAHLLPEDATTALSLDELGAIRRKVANLYTLDSGFLPFLIDTAILQLQSTRSVEQALAMVDSNINLLSDRVDLRYHQLRYLAWLIPTIGFIGTVIGLSLALELINPVSIDLGLVVDGLSIAFYTTLIALLASALLAFVQHSVQEREELALNEAGLYCLKNLINRVYIPTEKDGST